MSERVFELRTRRIVNRKRDLEFSIQLRAHSDAKREGGGCDIIGHYGGSAQKIAPYPITK